MRRLALELVAALDARRSRPAAAPSSRPPSARPRPPSSSSSFGSFVPHWSTMRPSSDAPHRVDRADPRGRPRSSPGSRRRAGGRGAGSAPAARCPGCTRSFTLARRTSRAMPPSSGSVEAPPSVTSTPPRAHEVLEVLRSPRQVEAARDVRRRGGRAVARELRRLRVGERREARVDAVHDVLQAAAGVGEQDHVEALAQAALAHVVVHDQRVGDLLVVEDHAHPARPTGCRSRSGARARRGRSTRWRGTSGARAGRVEVERQLRRHRSRAPARRPGCGRDDPRARRVVHAPGGERLLGRLDLEASRAARARRGAPPGRSRARR